jgi:hypothetical protein
MTPTCDMLRLSLSLPRARARARACGHPRPTPRPNPSQTQPLGRPGTTWDGVAALHVHARARTFQL